MKLQRADMSEQLSTQHTKGEKEKGAKQVARKRAEGHTEISEGEKCSGLTPERSSEGERLAGQVLGRGFRVSCGQLHLVLPRPCSSCGQSEIFSECASTRDSSVLPQGPGTLEVTSASSPSTGCHALREGPVQLTTLSNSPHRFQPGHHSQCPCSRGSSFCLCSSSASVSSPQSSRVHASWF